MPEAKGAIDNRLHFFDGLRGWAALIVLLHHLSLVFREWEEMLYNTPLNFLLNGDYAVFIFFILSGIVLSLGFFKSNNNSYLCGMALKRIPRLSIPIFICCFLTVIMMKTGLILNREAGELINNGWLMEDYNFEGSFLGAVVFSFRNVLFYFDTTYNSTLWTIGYEIQGSFLVLILLCGVNYIKKNLWPFWVGLALYLLFNAPILLSFGMGVFISYFFVNRKELIEKLQKSIPAKIIFAVLCFIAYWGGVFFSTQMPVDLLKQLSYAISAFFLIGLILIMPILKAFFSCGVSKFLGKISFPLYIVHFPIICSFTSYLIIRFEYPMANTMENLQVVVLFSILTIGMSLFVAWAFYPVEKLSIFTANKLFQYATGAAAKIAKKPAAEPKAV
jgi:peptidoglycan/LPS O-acetylase OafA/YrhL